MAITPVLPNAVFLNIPYDDRFRRQYLAYIVGLSQLGLQPKATLGIPGGRRKHKDVGGSAGNCDRDCNRPQLVVKRGEQAASLPRFFGLRTLVDAERECIKRNRYLLAPPRSPSGIVAIGNNRRNQVKEPGLDGRHRDKTPPKAGEIQQKRSDTLNWNLSRPIPEAGQIPPWEGCGPKLARLEKRQFEELPESYGPIRAEASRRNFSFDT